MNLYGVSLAFVDRSWIFLFLIVFFFLYVFYSQWVSQVWSHFRGRGTQHEFPRNRSRKRFLFLLSFLLIAFSYLGPRWGQKKVTLESHGLDICVAFDLSRSMDAIDLLPSRMQFVKNQLSAVFEDVEEHRFALVPFAGSSYIASPLTVDHSAFMNFLDPLETSFIGDQSTRVSSGLEQCLRALQVEDKEKVSDYIFDGAKTVLLISDGEDHHSGMGSVLSRYKKLKIPIHVFGVGTLEGGQIPVKKTGDYYREKNGSIVTTKLSEASLKKIAQETDAKYYRAENGIAVWKEYFEDLKSFKQKAKEEGLSESQEHRFQIFLFFGILLLLLEFLLTERGLGKYAFPLILLTLSSCQKILPEKFKRLNNVAVEAFKNKEFEKAKEFANEALEEKPDEEILIFNWSSIRLHEAAQKVQEDKKALEKGSLDELIQVTNQLEKESRIVNKKKAHYQKAQAYELTGDYLAAIKEYYQAIVEVKKSEKTNQFDAQIEHNLARLLSMKGKGKGSGGDGEPEDGEGEGDGPGDPNQKKDPESYEFKEKELSDQRLKELLESVHADEKEVQKKKAQEEAKKNSKNNSNGNMNRGKQY